MYELKELHRASKDSAKEWSNRGWSVEDRDSSNCLLSDVEWKFLFGLSYACLVSIKYSPMVHTIGSNM